MRRRLPIPPRGDLLMAIGFAALAEVNLWGHIDGFYGGGPRWIGVPLSLIATLPLAWRRHAPRAVLVLMTLGWMVPNLVVNVPIMFYGEFLPMLVAFYTVVAYGRDRRDDAFAVAIVALGTVCMNVGRPDFRDASEVVFELALYGGVYAAAKMVRARQRYAEAISANAEQRERQVVQHERARIARELHDVISHNVSVMCVQASAAERVLRTDPETAAEAMRRVKDAGDEALEEMRLLLGVLRMDDEPRSLAPQPCIAQIEHLVAQTRASGLRASFRVEGTPRPLPSALEMSAYRIVQEGLTNTLKHAGGTRAEVVVRYGEREVDVEVLDDGGANGTGVAGGHGLVGMRERASILGGRLTAGPRAEGGYAVRASIPLPQ